MTFWTTFTPQKVCWELTTVLTGGKGATSDWQNQLPLMQKSLKKLSQAGISGIRLAIFPEEVTIDGKSFHWEAIETMLTLCKKLKLDVDLCIGPYQYPNYPGIFLPKGLLPCVIDSPNSLDTHPELAAYGKAFLEEQLEKYSKDKRIRGFHFANEWPDKQRVKGKEEIRTFISDNFMVWAAAFLKANTNKPISMNTNIDASDKGKLRDVFTEIIGVLEDQARLGFDIYPSQETWSKAFLQKVRRLLEAYDRSYQWSCSHFSLCEMYFCEVEAQPWGSGQSWYRMIIEEENPNKKILQFTSQSLKNTFDKYIKKARPYEVSFWGADFWLSAELMGITWPLDQVSELSHAHHKHN